LAEASGESSSEASTEATEASTEATEASTEATEASTEASTETTETSTESTEVPTEVTEASEATTEAPETSTEAPETESKEVSSIVYWCDQGKWSKEIYYKGSNIYEREELDGQPDLSSNSSDGIHSYIRFYPSGGEIEVQGDIGISANIYTEGTVNFKGNLNGGLSISADCSVSVTGNVGRLLYIEKENPNSSITIAGNVERLNIDADFKGNLKIEGTLGGGEITKWGVNPGSHELPVEWQETVLPCAAGQCEIVNGVWSASVPKDTTAHDLGLHYYDRTEKVGFNADGLKEEYEADYQGVEYQCSTISDESIPAALKTVVNGKKLSFSKAYDINLQSYGQALHSDFGELEILFNIGKNFTGQSATVYHYHDDSSVTSETATVDANGMVSIKVRDLSSFLVTVEEKSASAPETKPESGAQPESGVQPESGTQPSSGTSQESKPQDEASANKKSPDTGENLTPRILAFTALLSLTAYMWVKKKENAAD